MYYVTIQRTFRIQYLVVVNMVQLFKENTFDNKRFRSNYSMFSGLVLYISMLKQCMQRLFIYNCDNCVYVLNVMHCVSQRVLQESSSSYTKIYIFVKLHSQYIINTFPKRVQHLQSRLSRMSNSMYKYKWSPAKYEIERKSYINMIVVLMCANAHDHHHNRRS